MIKLEQFIMENQDVIPDAVKEHIVNLSYFAAEFLYTSSQLFDIVDHKDKQQKACKDVSQYIANNLKKHIFDESTKKMNNMQKRDVTNTFNAYYHDKLGKVASNFITEKIIQGIRVCSYQYE